MIRYFARKEPSTEAIDQMSREARFDTVVYKDEGCTQKVGRWPWHLTNCPHHGQAFARINCNMVELTWKDAPLVDAVNPAMLTKLLADIALSNNGYLVLDYMPPALRRFAHSCAQLGLVQMRSGVVYRPGTTPGLVQVPYSTTALCSSQAALPDFEGAILQRQEDAGFYD